MAIDRSEWEMNFPGLHTYGQTVWHDDSPICGTREGIKRLRDALTKALDSPDGVSLCNDVFCNDGEGYSVPIYCLPYAEFEKLATPYSDEVAAAAGSDLWPFQLAVQPKDEDAI